MDDDFCQPTPKPVVLALNQACCFGPTAIIQKHWARLRPSQSSETRMGSTLPARSGVNTAIPSRVANRK